MDLEDKMTVVVLFMFGFWTGVLVSKIVDQHWPTLWNYKGLLFA